jgi:hypothetical protein
MADQSIARDVNGWWHGFHTFLTQGPPPFRLRELIALARSGVVQFSGPGLSVIADGDRGRFTAQSPALPGFITPATAMIDAWLPDISVERAASPLIEALYRDGCYTGPSGLLAVRSEDGALFDVHGRANSRRLVLGIAADGRPSAHLARPGRNSPQLAQNDRTARTLLQRVARMPASP